MNKYQFNEEKLEFTKVRPNIKTVLKRIFWVFLGSIALALLYYLVFGMFVLSPAERTLIRETELMQNEYERLSREMDNLNKVSRRIGRAGQKYLRNGFAFNTLELNQEVDISHYRALVEDPSFALAYHADSVISGLEQRAALVTRALYMAGNSIYEQIDSLVYLQLFRYANHPWKPWAQL